MKRRTAAGLGVVLLLLAAPPLLQANGGVARIVREPMAGRFITVYSSPTALNGTIVGTAIEAAGEFMTVEFIALASMLASVDGTHRGLGARLEPLPEPVAGEPTGEVAEGLKRRRTHVPVPPGPIPFVLDLLPAEGAAYQALFGPQYMTGPEMMMHDFRRFPHGLDRAQMECVSARTSIHNECFY